MRTMLRCAFAAVVLALGAQQAFAQSITSCPPGQAMQSSDPSGKRISCVPLPDVGAINSLISNETAARISADQALGFRIDALTPADIIGNWAVTGTTTCLQASNGFVPGSMSPAISSTANFVSQLAGTFMGTRTFTASFSGISTGTSHSLAFPSTTFTQVQPGVVLASPGSSPGGASVATLNSSFTWSIRASDGKLVVDDDNSIAQPFIAPDTFLGQFATIENVPSFVGYISRDKKTLFLTHEGMSMETSVRRNASGAETGRTPRFCARSRVLTRL